MAITEDYTQETLTQADIGGVMALVAEAGWNQVDSDWQLMIDAGDAVILRDRSGRICASALALPYQTGFGWISMVLVAKTSRRQGLATHLLADRVDYLQSRGLTPILDATELGAPVYTKAGFTGGTRLSRWQGMAGRSTHSELVKVAQDTDRDWIVALDAETFGAERRGLVDNFLSRPGSTCLTVPGNGFVIVRQGSRATQLGPLVARSQADAVTLIDAALSTFDGPVFFDAFDARADVTAHISALGFERQRGFLRMSLGDMPDFDGNGRAMLIAGPEYG